MIEPRRCCFVFALLFLLPVSAAAQAADNLTAQWPTHSWTRASPASVGLDEKALTAFDADLSRGKYMLVDSFQVFRCGKEVFAKKYSHDYGKIYGKEAKEKGPL